MSQRKNWTQTTGSGPFASSIKTPGQRPCMDSARYNRCLDTCTNVSTKKGYPCNGKQGCCNNFCYKRYCKDPWKVEGRQGGHRKSG